MNTLKKFPGAATVCANREVPIPQEKDVVGYPLALGTRQVIDISL
jgi:hypothetical protein